MPAIGGSIETITLNGREFAVPADTDATRKLGGFENEVQANGNGTARLIKTRVPWMVDGLTVEIDELRGDHEFLQDLANQADFFPVTATYASGAVWQGTGQIVGEVQFSNQNSSATLGLSGSGAMTRQ